MSKNTFLYFICLIIVPIVLFLVNKEYIYAGIFAGTGSLILYLTFTKTGKKIKKILF